MIRLSKTLSLPLDLALQSAAILARKRAGKSWLARLIAEQLLKAGIQTVIVDPKGDWWGVRSSADGKGAGFPVVILGGEHGDVPLERDSGEFVARFIVEQRVSVVIDLSDFRKGEVATFMAMFLETLYRMKRKDQYRTAMTLIVDEADAIAPQSTKGSSQSARGTGQLDNTARMLGAMEDIVRRGGQRGLGILMVTQRAAVLNKNVLTQTSVLMLLCTTGSQDIDAVGDWVSKHGMKEKAREVIDSLATLNVSTGNGDPSEAWVWAPGWPDRDGTFARIEVGQITTFDSGATPKIGEKRKSPKTVADVDLVAFEKDMAATILRAKEHDPKELQKQIRDLTKRLEEKKASDEATARKRAEEIARQIAEENPVVDQDAIDAAVEQANMDAARAIDRLETLVQDVIGDLDRTVAKMRETISDATKEAMSAPRTVDRRPEAPRRIERRDPEPVAVAARTAPPRPDLGGEKLQSVEGLEPRHVKILNAMARLESVRIAQPDRRVVAGFAKYSPKSTSFTKGIGQLQTGGYLEYPSGGLVTLTDKGRSVAQSKDSPTLAELHQSWYDMLEPRLVKILRPLVASYPQAMTREDLSQECGYSVSSTSYTKGIGQLTTFGVAHYPRAGMVAATAILFPPGIK